MNRKRKRVEDEDDMSSTASQSSEESTFSTEESEIEDNEEMKQSPEFKQILKILSRAVPRQKALDLLHSMAVSKDILFWTPKGEMLYKNRRIPVTSMAELCEYILLPYNSEVPKPRALNTFLNGIAEIGINKALVKNKKILAELIVKENEIQSEDDSDEESDTDTASQGSEQSKASETEQDEESDRGFNDENSRDGEQNQGTCPNCKSADQCDIAVISCPKCKWQEGFIVPLTNMKCDICEGELCLDKSCLSDVFQLCNACGHLVHANVKSGREQHFETGSESVSDRE